MSKGPDQEWITFGEGRRILAIGKTAFDALVESGRLTVRRVPGSIPRVLKPEVEAIAEACTAPACAS
jgi:hypothetical protein